MLVDRLRRVKDGLSEEFTHVESPVRPVGLQLLALLLPLLPLPLLLLLPLALLQELLGRYN